ncbi:hypothetical protein D6789_04350 [Candidatus Woesearchaeota archaeon]|nr:MAG: hypothetical protein D6789_04350 [Candidatus Woesearchaeota archaeon]
MTIITLMGTPGSGKSTLGKLLAQQLGFKHYSMGDLQRRIATQHGWTINELMAKNVSGAFDSDTETDELQTRLGKEEDDFVIDGRLSWHFIPHSFKVFLDCEERERARRLVERGSASDNAADIDDAMRLNAERLAHEKKNFLQKYGLDPYDKRHYDLVLDSTHTPPEELARQVRDALQRRIRRDNGKFINNSGAQGYGKGVDTHGR